MVDIINTQKKFIFKEIDEHEKTLDEENPRDFVDLYLLEMKSSEGFSKKDLALNLMDFLDAGTETSSTTLKWIILYLTLYQDVQDRCRQEIISVLGASACSVSDMIRLPYLQVVVLKYVLRLYLYFKAVI